MLVMTVVVRVFAKAPPAEVVARLTVIAPPTVVGLPPASRRSTVSVPQIGVVLLLAVIASGAVVMTSCEAPAADTVKVIVPVSAPPLADAVSVTVSAFE
jgi:cytochrome b561